MPWPRPGPEPLTGFHFLLSIHPDANVKPSIFNFPPLLQTAPLAERAPKNRNPTRMFCIQFILRSPGPTMEVGAERVNLF